MFPWNFFSFSKEMKEKMQQMKPEEIHSFVQNMMKDMFEPHSNQMNPEDFMKNFHPFQNQRDQPNHTGNNEAKLDYSLFETHDDIYVRIKVPSEESLKQLKLTHTSSVLTLEHFPEIGNEYNIPLPTLVKKKGTAARFKDGILQIKLPKNIDLQFSEVDIIEDQ